MSLKKKQNMKQVYCTLSITFTIKKINNNNKIYICMFQIIHTLKLYTAPRKKQANQVYNKI